MKKNILIGLIIASALLAGCTIPIQNTRIQGSGNLVSEERQVSDFSRVSLEGVGDLEIVVGDTEALTIEAEDNIIGRIESYVSGDTLHIGFERFINAIPTRGITYTLTVKDLNGVEVSGYGDVYVASLTTDTMDIDVSGGGWIEMENLTADSLQVRLSGAGDFELSGMVDRQQVNLSGAGSYKAQDLKCRAAQIDISGAGSAQVWVTETLDVNLSGVGSLQYYGDATVDQNISGVGKVISLGAHE